MLNSLRKKNFAKTVFHARRTTEVEMDGEKCEKIMNCDTMGSRPAAKVCAREFTIYVKLRNDICYLLKCKEDAKGQDIMDEV